ncbi:MAG: hemerythrin domain-containing protein [Candidatus Dormiibacterota bacterium]
MPETREPIDTSDMYIPHNMLRDAMGRADALIGSVASGDTARATVVGSFFDNVLRFLDAHHQGEDILLYPLARERAPEHVAVFDRMQAEHHAAAAADAATTETLAAWMADPGPGNASSLTSALGDLRTVLGAHLEDEERSFLPIAATTFSAEEWGELPGHVARTFTGDKLWLILGLVFEQMTDEQRALTLAHMPRPVVDMWSGVGAASFAAFIGDVRGAAESAPR